MTSLKNHGYRQALILSPFIAMYGFAPIYLFTEIDWIRGMISFIALIIMIFGFWVGNIWLFKRHLKKVLKYLSSYAALLIFQLLMLILSPLSNILENSTSYYLYILISTIAINSIILLIVNSNSLNQSKIRMEKDFGELKLQHSEALIKNLLQQLQPHFLFNTLSTLKSLIAENPSKAMEYTVRLSEFLRYSVNSPSKELVLVKEEVDFVKDYLALQEKRFDKALVYTIDLPQSIMHAKIPTFALQTLVENAMKHNKLTEKVPLKISITMEAERIRVSNNKLPKVLKIPSGTGLANLNKRYQLTCSKSLEIKESENDFTVFLKIIS